jgi:hypothetical protein
MKTITLEEAYALIQSAHAVVVNDENAGLCYPSLWEFGDDEWLFCSYEDDHGWSYDHSFNEEPQEIKFNGTSIFMKDSNGEDVELILLVPMNKLAEISI